MNFVEQLAHDRSLVEEALDRSLPAPETAAQLPVLSAMRYSLLGGGKRIRAILALSFCRALGHDERRALPAAAALEMVHAYSLIHDDLPCMDDDDMRRGKPSCHKAFGEAVAVLAGDGLLTLAFETLSHPDVMGLLSAETAISQLRELSTGAGEYGMLGGQAIDVCNEGVPLSPAVHREMMAMKTGALLRAAVACGCLAGNASSEQLQLAVSYAHDLGLAFQITDDLLDVKGDASTLGKPIGSDLADHKNTYVSIHGIEAAEQKAAELCQRALDTIEALFPTDHFLHEFTRMLADRQY